MKNKRFLFGGLIFGIAVLLQLAGLVFLVQSYDWNWLVLMAFGPQYPTAYWVCQGLTLLVAMPLFGMMWQKYGVPLKTLKQILK